MHGRGLTKKTRNDNKIILERAMLTRRYMMTWDLDRCVGCQIGPLVCPKEAITIDKGKIAGGRLLQKPSLDIDPGKCVLCGMCEIMCPKKAITLTINDRRENPVVAYGAFPSLIQSTVFQKEAFDWGRKDAVIENCPPQVISFDEGRNTLIVDDEHCLRCRQCEIAGNGAFQVEQSWEGKVVLRREKCVKGCLACADICPTRALHIDEEGELVLADYYCIKCGACMQVCPILPEYETVEYSLESQGVSKKVAHKRLVNTGTLPIMVERWRVRHTPVKSAAWIEALAKMADDKAGMVEIDHKRALKRIDLFKALHGVRS